MVSSSSLFSDLSTVFSLLLPCTPSFSLLLMRYHRTPDTLFHQKCVTLIYTPMRSLYSRRTMWSILSNSLCICWNWCIEIESVTNILLIALNTINFAGHTAVMIACLKMLDVPSNFMDKGRQILHSLLFPLSFSSLIPSSSSFVPYLPLPLSLYLFPFMSVSTVDVN